MEIGERIRARREELGMSQDELAKKVGYTSRSSVAKVETNANGMVQSKVVAFAKALQTTPAYLMGWDESEQSEDEVSHNTVVYNFNGQIIKKRLSQEQMLYLHKFIISICSKTNTFDTYSTDDSHREIAAYGSDGTKGAFNTPPKEIT